jgi:hypothetical protein
MPRFCFAKNPEANPSSKRQGSEHKKGTHDTILHRRLIRLLTDSSRILLIAINVFPQLPKTIPRHSACANSIGMRHDCEHTQPNPRTDTHARQTRGQTITLTNGAGKCPCACSRLALSVSSPVWHETRRRFGGVKKYKKRSQKILPQKLTQWHRIADKNEVPSVSARACVPAARAPSVCTAPRYKQKCPKLHKFNESWNRPRKSIPKLQTIIDFHPNFDQLKSKCVHLFSVELTNHHFQMCQNSFEPVSTILSKQSRVILIDDPGDILQFRFPNNIQLKPTQI